MTSGSARYCSSRSIGEETGPRRSIVMAGRWHNHGGVMRVLVAVLVVMGSVPALGDTTQVSAADISAVYRDDLRGSVFFRLKNGQEVEAPRSEGQAQQLDPAISPDKRWVAWLVTDHDCCAGRPVPRGIVVLHDRQMFTLRVTKMIWKWAFWQSQTAIVLALGPEHPGQPAEYLFYDLRSRSLRDSISRFELNEFDPPWARAAGLTQRMGESPDPSPATSGR
jgi:hypothetical protein